MLKQLFKDYRTIAVVGNTNSAKSSLVLDALIKLKKDVKIEIYVFGVSTCLYPVLEKYGIHIIYNQEDVLDLKIKNAVIYIDEISIFFDPHTKNRKIDRLKKWINRLYHPENNNFLICSTSESGYWNKTMNDLIKGWIVKEIDYDSLVLRTPIRRKVEGIESGSEYRLTLGKGEYFILTDSLTKKGSFAYNPELDAKKDNPNPFKTENKSEISNEVKSEKEEDLNSLYILNKDKLGYIQ